MIQSFRLLEFSITRWVKLNLINNLIKLQLGLFVIIEVDALNGKIENLECSRKIVGLK